MYFKLYLSSNQTFLFLDNNDNKTKVLDEFIFYGVLLQCLFNCWTRWVNWFTIGDHVSLLLNLGLHAYMYYVNKQLCRLFFCVCVSPLVCSSWNSPQKNILQQLFASGSMNIGKFISTCRHCFSEYSPMFTLPSAIIIICQRHVNFTQCDSPFTDKTYPLFHAGGLSHSNIDFYIIVYKCSSHGSYNTCI